VTLMITAVGPFTRLVHELAEGDHLWLRGAFGHRASPRQPRQGDWRWWAAATAWRRSSGWRGRQLPRGGSASTAIVGARTAADLLYVEHFAHLAARLRPGALTVHAHNRGWQPPARPGRVTDVLAPRVAAWRESTTSTRAGRTACWPRCRNAGHRRLVIPCQTSWEAYMRCAIGICGACEHAGQVLCLDGPVLAH
jgi:dihydroorotate dehydrogenase electron transfer subunit